jgi:predicted nucleic acid-binding Zn finger protein
LPDLGFCVSAIQVMGESRRKEEYICFPEHLCTCYSFFYDIVGRGEQLCCKHQLAARLAEAVSKHQDIEVTDEELAHMLAKL